MLKLKLLDSFMSARCEVALEEGATVPDLSLILMQPGLYQGDQYVHPTSLTITNLQAVHRLRDACDELIEAHKLLAETAQEPKPDLPILSLP